MFAFNLLSAWRNLKKNKVVSVINILGLAIGLTCAIFAIVFAHHELTYEDYHENADRVCRVYTYGSFGSMEKVPTTFGATANDLEATFPEILIAARSRSLNGVVFKDERPIQEDDIVVAEESIFSILSFRFLKGGKPSGPNNIVLSQKMAKKYFGMDNPLGKSLDISIQGNKQTYTVEGVIEDLPSNTHVKASFVIPFDQAYRMGWNPDKYYGTNYNVYNLLREDTDVEKLNSKIAQKADIPLDIENVKYGLVPIKRIHLYEDITQNAYANLFILLIGGFVVLAITIFNYINSSTILFSTRMKEIGIKKTIGGSRGYIFRQFFVDTGLAVSLGFGLAFMLFIIFKPYFNDIMGAHVGLDFNWIVISAFAGLFMLTVLISGLYPAYKSLNVKTVSLISEGSISSLTKNRLSNVLITIQFVVAVLLLQFIIISQKQSSHMFDQDVIKFNSDDVVCMDGYAWGNLHTVKQDHIKKVLRSANPNYPVDIRYYNDITADQGKSYLATGMFINIFTGTIIFNAMMGLFGLSFFMSERKNKEIGLRKVCGATVNSVFWKLSSGFVKKLLLAFLIASPLGYIIGQGYISTFTTQIDIGLGIFLLAAFLSVVMVFLATGWKIVYTANRNPVEALWYE